MSRLRPLELITCIVLASVWACGPAAEKTTTTITTTEAEGTPTRGPLAPTLRAVVWDDYISPEIVEAFQKEFGVRVEVDFVNNNEEVISRLEAGETWDIWTPSDYAVQIAKKKGLLARLDHDRIPNLGNVGRRYQNLAYDRQFEYAVPYYWGTTGLAYSRQAFPEGVDTWAAVFSDSAARRRNTGRIQLLDDMRETMSIALIYLRQDPNTTDPTAIAAARDLLIGTKAVLAEFESETYEEDFTSGKTLLAHGWSGDLLQAVATKPDTVYVLPKEGFMVWIDNFAIPARSPNKATAEVFLDFMLRPEVAAKITTSSLNPTTVPASRPLVPKEILEGQIFELPEDRPFWIFRDLGEANALFEAAWAEVIGR